MPETSSRDQQLGVILVAGAAVAWSTAGYFSQLVHVALFPTLFWRNVFGGTFMLLYLVARERGGTRRAFGTLGRIGWAAAVLNGLSMVFYLTALRNTSVANVVIIYATAPFVAAALAFLAFRDRASRRTLATGGVALAGLAITVLGSSSGSDSLVGDLFAVLMTFSLATFTIIARRYRDRSMIAAATASAWIGALIALPFSLTTHVSSVQLGQLALFGVTSFGLGLILYSIGARHLHAARSALISALDTPLAPLWVWIAFGEQPAVAAVVGGAIVMIAVVTNIVTERAPLVPVLALEPVAERSG
jgi:drug/metabolite transporter (DMT)-like permease